MAVRLPDRHIENPDLFGGLLIPTPEGQRIPLERLATIKRVSGPTVIQRDWGKRRAVVTANVVDRDLGSFVAEAQRRVRAELPNDRVEFGGQYENLARASKTPATVVIGGLISSTLLTLFVLPTLYAWIGRVRVVQ